MIPPALIASAPDDSVRNGLAFLLLVASLAAFLKVRYSHGRRTSSLAFLDRSGEPARPLKSGRAFRLLGLFFLAFLIVPFIAPLGILLFQELASAASSSTDGPSSPLVAEEEPAELPPAPPPPVPPASPTPVPPTPAPGILHLANPKSFSVSSISGFASPWKVAFDSKNRGGQLLGGPFKSSVEFNEFLDLGWNTHNLRVESIAGDESGWYVLMSEDGAYGNLVAQQVIHSFDQTAISGIQREGLSITSIAGRRGSWKIAFSDMPRWGLQRFTEATPWDANRSSWIQSRFREGFRITSVAGCDLPDDPEDGWVFVVTKNSGFGEQLIYGPGPWPGDAIDAKANEGFQITSSAGGNDVWIVVLSKTEGPVPVVLSVPDPLDREIGTLIDSVPE